MIIIKENKIIEPLLKKAVKMASFHDRGQIFSITEKISEIHPIQFFYAAKQTNKNRMFWTSHTQDFCMVGVGNAYEMVADDSRFDMTKEKWEELIEKATIDNPYKTAG